MIRRRGPRGALVTAARARALAYPRSVALGLLSGGLWLLVVLGVWAPVVRGGAMTGSLASFHAYVLTAFVLTALGGTPVEMQVTLRVRSGEIVADLARPLSFVEWQLAQIVGQGMVDMGAALLVATAAAAWLQPVQLPGSLAVWALLLATATLGCAIQLALVHLGIVAAMLTMHGQGVLWIRRALVSLLSGFLVPLELMPAGLRRAAELFPFRDIVHTPASVAAGTLDPTAACVALLRQALWLGALAWAGHAAFRVARRTVVIQGG